MRASIGVGFIIMAEATLSFLGIGVQEPAPTWGGMIRDGLPALRTDPYLALFGERWRSASPSSASTSSATGCATSSTRGCASDERRAAPRRSAASRSPSTRSAAGSASSTTSASPSSTGEIVGIVGESGSGKSVTALAIMGLLGEQGHIAAGRITLAGTELTRLDRRAWRRVRGRDIGMIFQEPTTCLNPLFPVGFQIAEVLVEHEGLAAARRARRAIALMDRGRHPGRRRARRRLSAPDVGRHEAAGDDRHGARLRAAAADRRRADHRARRHHPGADPDLIRELNADLGMSVLLITHDMGVVAEMADRVLVMYAGRIVEEAPVGPLFEAPGHPYTRLLLHSIPRATEKRAGAADDRRGDAVAGRDAGGLPLPPALPGRDRTLPNRGARPRAVGRPAPRRLLAARRDRPRIAAMAEAVA